MNSKSLIQILLIILVIIISAVLYIKYFHQESLKITDKKTEILDDPIGNTIKDIEYKSEDEKGNIYIIRSKYGEFKNNDNNVIFMTKVTAILQFSDGTSINLVSANAKYNIADNDTNFFNNVNLNYLNHNVVADNIDIFFKDSKLEAYNNLVYRNLDLNLIADKVEVDLITKNSKIFMFNDKKVKIFKAN